MKRVVRNRMLLWLIFLGLANFATYTFFYWYFQGDARNGFIRFEEHVATGVVEAHYYLKGHFLRSSDGMASAPVSRAVWIYSFVHSISIWPTIGAVLVSMLILARPHIIATIKSDALVGGRSLVAIGIFIVILVTFVSTAVFAVNLAQAIHAVAAGRDFGL